MVSNGKYEFGDNKITDVVNDAIARELSRLLNGDLIDYVGVPLQENLVSGTVFQLADRSDIVDDRVCEGVPDNELLPQKGAA